ncbi:MAG: Rap1a/Tai family immunity protein [Gammaproteobacteria bacterium]|nr:Rap1a/Tai family immunity protein [Gammaproteobacteria bacterium]
MKIRLTTIVATGLLASQPVFGLNTMTAGELAEDCTGPSEAVTPTCVAFVRGFIDGALATDPRVAMNVERELNRDESFAERAYRTRLGQRMDRYGPSFFADFCIPTPVPLQDIVNQVAAELRQVADRNEPARELVYRTLRRGYPCEVPDD